MRDNGQHCKRDEEEREEDNVELGVEIAITPTIQSGSALAFCDAPFLVNVETL